MWSHRVWLVGIVLGHNLHFSQTAPFSISSLQHRHLGIPEFIQGFSKEFWVNNIFFPSYNLISTNLYFYIGWQNSFSYILKRCLNHSCSWVKHIDKIEVHIYVHDQRVACLAQQSDPGPVLMVRRILLPRQSRQRSRLIVYTSKYKQSL